MRLYICHTFYHVYVSVVKEIYLQRKDRQKGTLLLSTMSTDFGDLDKRLTESGLFAKVEFIPECHPRFFEEKFTQKLGIGNPIYKLISRRKYGRYIVRNEEKYLNYNYSDYDDIFVYCDSDPIGIYLNAKHVPYTSSEDGNNSGAYNEVIIANESMFALKRLLTKMNFLYMQDGYSKYSKGFEVNSAEGVNPVGRNIIEFPVSKIAESFNADESELLYRTFKSWENPIAIDSKKDAVMVLTQPVCTEENRIRMYKKLIGMYEDDYFVIIKPHPIDKIDYEKAFPNCLVLPRTFPVEILNVRCEYDIKKIVTVYSTSLESLHFAEEKEAMGVAFMDEFEPREMHSDLMRKESNP